MTYFIQACVKDGHIFTVRVQTHPVVGLCTFDPLDFAINAEVAGDQQDASDVLAALTLTDDILAGLPIIEQRVFEHPARKEEEIYHAE